MKKVQMFDLMDTAEDKMFQITNNFLKTDYTEMSSALAQAINRIDELRTKKEEISGVPRNERNPVGATYSLGRK